MMRYAKKGASKLEVLDLLFLSGQPVVDDFLALEGGAWPSGVSESPFRDAVRMRG